jgi:molybdopterin-guanine dinucleotide biosynthesis protein A
MLKLDRDFYFYSFQTTLVIQAGGASSRIGRNKALIPFLGKTLIERVVQRVERITPNILIVCKYPDELGFLGYPCVQDVLTGKGVLGGFYTALLSANTPIVAVVACDMPFINADLIMAEVLQLRESAYDVVIPMTPMGMEPFHAVYRRERCLKAVLDVIIKGERRLTSFLDHVNVFGIPPEVYDAYGQPSPFFNINTLDDLQEAENQARLFS